MPYCEENVDAPEEDTLCWSATTYLICFEIVEFHQTDRVRLQFGFAQDFTGRPQIMTRYHEVDRRGDKVNDWRIEYRNEILQWDRRFDQVLRGDKINGSPKHSTQYLDRYVRDYMPYLSINPYLNDPRPRPRINQSEPHPSYQTQMPTTSQYHTPSPPQMPTTSQFQTHNFNYDTPSQFPIFDDQSFISPSIQQYPQNYTSPTPQFHNQQDFTQPPSQQFQNFTHTSNQQFTTFPDQSSQQFTSFTQQFTAYTQVQNQPQTQQNFGWVNSPTVEDLLNSSWSQFAGSSMSGLLNAGGPSNTASIPCEDEDEAEDLEQQPRQVVRRNPRRARHPPGCGTGGHR